MVTTQGMLVELLDLERVEAVLICIPCLQVRQAQPNILLGLHDPGDPWEQWGCRIQGCGQWFPGPWYLEWHTAAEHPGWTATYELRRPYPNQRMRVVYRQVEDPRPRSCLALGVGCAPGGRWPAPVGPGR